MRRTLFVHIGTAKTGSTSIQHMLDSLPALLEQVGVHVPVTACRNGSHNNLIREYTENGYWKYVPWLGGWADLSDELTRCPSPQFVISAEQFTNPLFGREGATRVATLARTADLDVKVIGYVRPQYQLLESKYVQQVRTARKVAPFEAVLNECPENLRFDYNAVFRPWRETFGDRLGIYPLEPAQMPDGLLTHFLTLLGAGELVRAAVALPRMNERLGAKHVEVMRLIGLALMDQMIDKHARFRILESMRCHLPALLPDDAPFAGLSPVQVRAVTEQFAESNARFAREYGIDAGGVLFRGPGDALTRPNLALWEDFSEAERTRVRRFVQDAVGVNLPTGSLSTRRHVKWWNVAPRRPPRVVSACDNNWHDVVVPSLAEFTPSRPVSVVVSGHVPSEALVRTLAALEGQTYPRDMFEVVMIDTGSNELQELSWAPALNVRVVPHQEKAGGVASGTRNVGAQAAAHDILLFLDGGLMPEAGWLAAHARWHHVVSDVLTIGWEGSIMAVDALAVAPFGVHRRFFNLVDGFDVLFTDRAKQNIEFGIRACTHGGLLVPVRDAGCFAPGSWQPGQVAEMLGRTDVQRRRSGVPHFAVTITATAGMVREAFETASRIWADLYPDLVTLLDVREDAKDVEWVRRQVEADPLVRFGWSDDARDEFPSTPFHVRVPAGAKFAGHLVRALESALGDAVAATLVLADGSRVSIIRACTLHRAHRTGHDIADFGNVVTINARSLQSGTVPLLTDAWLAMVRAVTLVRWAAGRILDVAMCVSKIAHKVVTQIRCLRSLRDVPLFLQWLRWEVKIGCRQMVRRIVGTRR